MSGFNEATVEEAALEWFWELGYAVAHGPDIAPESATPERADDRPEGVIYGWLLFHV